MQNQTQIPEFITLQDSARSLDIFTTEEHFTGIYYLTLFVADSSNQTQLGKLDFSVNITKIELEVNQYSASFDKELEN